jgi:hypothetical protein
MSQPIHLTCDIDIEQTVESFHAHAIPNGVEIYPGDVILVHDAPAAIGFGERYTGTRKATLFRANPLIRFLTQLSAIFEITELYEVGFQPATPKG